MPEFFSRVPLIIPLSTPPSRPCSVSPTSPLSPPGLRGNDQDARLSPGNIHFTPQPRLRSSSGLISPLRPDLQARSFFPPLRLAHLRSRASRCQTVCSERYQYDVSHRHHHICTGHSGVSVSIKLRPADISQPISGIKFHKVRRDHH